MGEQRYVEVSGGGISVTTSGEGAPVIFIHGAGGDGHNWDGVVERLEDRYRCIVVDRAGYGASRWGGEPWPTRADHAEHLLTVTEACDAIGGFVVGTSGGAITAIGALLRDPSAFAKAILIEPVVVVQRSGAPPLAPMHRPEPDPSLTFEERCAASIRLLDAAAWDGMDPGIRQRYVDSFPAMARETSSGPFIVDEVELAALTLPISVVYGSATPERISGLAETLVEVLPNAELKVIEGAAHLMYLTHTDEVTAYLDAYLSSKV